MPGAVHNGPEKPLTTLSPSLPLYPDTESIFLFAGHESISSRDFSFLQRIAIIYDESSESFSLRNCFSFKRLIYKALSNKNIV